MDKFTIVRDTREKVSQGWSYEPNAYCEGTVLAKLDAGDYSIEGLEDYICIERKQTIDEFAHNCIEKRWKNCMYKMSQCKHKFMIFEFGWDDVNNYPLSAKVPARVRKKLRIPAAYIRKVIHTAREDFNIHVIAAGNQKEAERIAYRLLRKAYELSLRR